MHGTMPGRALHILQKPFSNFFKYLRLPFVALPNCLFSQHMPAFEEENMLQDAEACQQRADDSEEEVVDEDGSNVEEVEDDDDEDGSNVATDEDDLCSIESFRSKLDIPQKYLQLPLAKEKQISIDPVSLRQSSKLEAQSSPPTAPPPPEVVKHPLPLQQPPLLRPRYLSSSLPCSATSSPNSSWAFSKSFKKWRNPTQKPHPALHSLTRQQSVARPQFAHPQLGMPLRRSKSCGDGRSCPPSDEFDILSRSTVPSIISASPGNGVQVIYDCTKDPEEANNDTDSDDKDEKEDRGFKCGALCLFLPMLSKKKQDQLQLPADEGLKREDDHTSVVSRMASLERFECGSWSSAILDVDEEDSEGGINSYFDLPLELIRCTANYAHSPVKTAFVFERDGKGVLKKSAARMGPRRSHESSSRHVRFSTAAPVSFPSSPASACITPRLAKAREEFNALLEAQNACINF